MGDRLQEQFRYFEFYKEPYRMPEHIAYEKLVRMWEAGDYEKVANKVRKLPKKNVLLFGAYFLDRRNIKDTFNLFRRIS